MNPLHQIAIEMLEVIDENRSGIASLDELEAKLWRLLDRAGESFPPILAGKVEDLVLELQKLRRVNRAFGHEGDEDRGVEEIYNDVIGSLARFTS